MQQFNLSFETKGRSFTNITTVLNTEIAKYAKETGLCNIFLQHTSASLIICENADSQVLRDLECFMSDLVKDGDKRFLHTDEGVDDMPAHIRTVLTQNSLTIPITSKQLALGTWQGIFLWEHRLQAHRRKIVVTL
jgi:secondary thiamine-phosphate synthase enzyme